MDIHVSKVNYLNTMGKLLLEENTSLFLFSQVHDLRKWFRKLNSIHYYVRNLVSNISNMVLQ